MGSVVSSIGSFVGDVIEFAVDDIISPVVDAVGDVVSGMLDDPISAILTVASFVPGVGVYAAIAKAGLAAVRGDWTGAALSLISAGYSHYIAPSVDSWISETAGEVFGTTSNFGDLGAEIAVETATSGRIQDILIATGKGAAGSAISAAVRKGDIGNAALIGGITGGASKYLESREFVPEEGVDYDDDAHEEAIYDIEAAKEAYETSKNYLYDGLSEGTSTVRNAFKDLPDIAQEIIVDTAAATAAAAISGRGINLEEILPTTLTQAAAKVYLAEGVIKDLYQTHSDATPEFINGRVAVINKALDGVIRAAYTGADAYAAFEGVMTEDAYNQLSDGLMRVIESEDVGEFLKDYSTKNDEYYAKYGDTEELRTEINTLIENAQESPLGELHAGKWEKAPFQLGEMKDKIAAYNKDIHSNKRIQSRQVWTADSSDEGADDDYSPWTDYGPGHNRNLPGRQNTGEMQDGGDLGQDVWYSTGHIEYRRFNRPQSSASKAEQKVIEAWLDQHNLHYDDYLATTEKIEELRVKYDEANEELNINEGVLIEAMGTLDTEVVSRLTPVAAKGMVDSLLRENKFDPEFYERAYRNEDGTWKDGADSSLTPHEHWLRAGRTNSFNQEYNDARVDYTIRKNIVTDSNIKLPQIVWSRNRKEILESDNPQEKYKELLDTATSKYINDIKIANNISTVEDIDVGGTDAIHASSVDLLDNLIREAEASDTEFAKRPFYDKIPVPTYEKTYDGEGYESVDPRDMGTEEGDWMLGYVPVGEEYVLGRYLIKKDESGWQSEEFDPKLNRFVKYGPQPGDLSAPTYKTYKEERDAEHLRKLEATGAKIDYEALKKRAVDLLTTQADNIINAFRSEDTYEDKVAKKLYNDWRAQGHDLKAMAKLIGEMDVTEPLGTLEAIVALQETEDTLGELIAFKNAVKEEGIKSEEMQDLYERITNGFTVTEEDQDAFAIFEEESNADKIVANWKEEQIDSRERYITELQNSDSAFKPFYSDSFGADVIPKIDPSAKGTLFIPLRAIDGPMGYDNIQLRKHIEDINSGIKLSPAKIAELSSSERALYNVAQFVASQKGKFDDAASPIRTAFNAAVLAVDAGGEMLRAFTDFGRFVGAAPEGTDWSAVVDSVSKAATASYTEDYRAAQTEIHKNIKDAKGFWGTLSAAGESFTKHPGVFLADIVAKEVIQELPLIAASAGTGLAVSGGLRAVRLSNTLARNIGVSTALTENNILQMVETAGGASGEAYRRIYRAVKDTGMSDAEADAYATQMALTIGTTAAIFELTAGGGKDIMDKFAARFVGGKQTAFRSSLEEWKRRAKGIGREGITEGFEEAAIQEFLTSQAIYSATGEVPFDLAGDMTYAAIQGVLGGSGTAATIVAMDVLGTDYSKYFHTPPPTDVGSPAGNALVNYNPIIRDSFNDASQNPNSPDYDSAAQQAGEENLKDAFGWNEFFNNDGTIIDFERDSEGVWRDNLNDATNVLNTVNPDKYTTIDEVKTAFADAGTELNDIPGATDFTPTYNELLPYTGETSLDLGTIRTVVDNATFGTADANRIATEAGYTLGPDELASFIAGLDEGVSSPADINNALLSHIDKRQLDSEEVTELLGGVPATPEQIAALTGQGGPTFQEDQTGVVQDYRGLREVTTDEVVAKFADEGYTRPDAETDPEGAAAFDAEIAKYVGVSADPLEEDTFGRIITDIDPRYITEGEARQVYEDLGIVSPIKSDLDRFVGLGDETRLSADVESYLPVATYNYLANLKNEGVTSTELDTLRDVLGGGISDVRTDLGKDIAGVRTDLGEDIAGLDANIDDVANILGIPGRDVTSADIAIVESLIADQIAADALTDEQLIYDVTGDKAVGAEDLTMLQNIMAGTASKADIAATNPFASTGLYGAIDTSTANQLAAQQAQQTQTAIQTAIANQTAVEDQRRQQAADQQFMAQLLQTTPVKVDTPDPKKIEYVYDPFGDSIFATKQQEDIYKSSRPGGTFAASGGLIEDETDTILRVLEGR